MLHSSEVRAVKAGYCYPVVWQPTGHASAESRQHWCSSWNRGTIAAR